MRITLKQLSVFKAICDNGQLSKAARQLHRSVPAVSMSLKELETSLNNKLLERTAHGLLLTDAGQLALQQANIVLKQVQSLEDLFAKQAKGFGGSLRIGANKTAGNYVLSRKLPQFKALYPSVNVRLKISSSNDIEAMLERNELDIAFISHKPKNKTIHYQTWMKDRLCIVTAPKHKLAHRVATATDLSATTWILDEENSSTRVESLNLLKEIGASVQDEIIMNTMGAIKRAVSTGLGLSVLPRLAVDAELQRGDLKEVRTYFEIPEREIYLIYKSQQFSPLIDRFLKSCEINIRHDPLSLSIR